MIDIKQARLAYDSKSGAYIDDAPNFACFSPAYVYTNECVRTALRALKPEKGARVLSVAASGDQPLFYKLAGASLVDTFDISFNAKMMMDIKTTAIQHLDRMDCLYLLGRINRGFEISDIEQYKKIAEFMPADTRGYIECMRGAKLVRTGGMLDLCLNSGEYDSLRESVKTPFEFKWTDLTDLSQHLTQEYDQIYLSNILQYNTSPEYTLRIANELMLHLSAGGKILLNVAPFFYGDEIIAVKKLDADLRKRDVGYVNIMRDSHQVMAILQKNR